MEQLDDELSEDYSVTSFEWTDDEAPKDAKAESKVEKTEEAKKGFLAPVSRCREELFRLVGSLYKSAQYSDIVIHCYGGKLPGHKIILGSTSLLMRDLLADDHILDIYLLDFDVATVATALQLVYTGTILVNNRDLTEVKLILNLLGLNKFEITELKDRKKKETKNKLKVKHEKNLGSRKLPVEPKTVMSRKKRVFMANLDQSELTCDFPDCQKTFPALYKLKIHKLIHSESYPFICMNCGKGFNNKYKMHSHEKKKLCEVSNVKPVKVGKPVKTVNVNIYNCSECPTSFSLVKDLKRHIQLTHRVKAELTCVHCSTVCRSQKNLITHLKVVHNDHESGLKCCCGICGKKFEKLSNLEDHTQRHNDIKQFGCMYCPKRCATKQDLDRHLRSHSGEATFTCQFCSRNFVHRKTYTTHVRKHLGQKPYQCRPCNKSFGALNYLKKHQNSHLRKGDQTRIVTAKKGGRGSMTVSYIEQVSAQVSLVDTSILETNTNTIYIPGPHYIQTGDSTVTPLGQMQVITGDYSEVSRLTYDVKMSDNIYTGADCPVQLQHRSSEPDQDDGDDGYLIDFLDHPASTQTTLDKL